MGMFDSIHTGWHCGQVKCFGRAGKDYVPGDRVHLVVASPYSRREASLYDSLHEVCLGDFQLVAEESLYVLVRYGRLIDFSSQRDASLPLLDNQGRPYDRRIDILVGTSPAPPGRSIPPERVRRPVALAPHEQIRSCVICAGLRRQLGRSSWTLGAPGPS